MDAEVIEKYRRAGAVAGKARDYGATLVREGALLLDVANAVEDFIRKEGAKPAFPCCLSRNDEAAHYTPPLADTTKFAVGDIVKLDCGVEVDGYIGDTATTVEVGSTRNQELSRASKEALEAASRLVRNGLEIREIGQAVEATIRGFGFSPIVNLTGHSVDRYHQHAGISIPNVPTGRGALEGPIAVAIEPFATTGLGRVKDGGGGHIYHLIAPKPQRDPVARQALAYIVENHSELPFAERWVANAIPASKVSYAMRVLERAGVLHQYPILRESSGGLVSQFEQTFLVLEDRVEITTRST
ncbi:MAG: type II methionyl aminopeptidase [Thermoplasmatota archaeon]